MGINFNYDKKTQVAKPSKGLKYRPKSEIAPKSGAVFMNANCNMRYVAKGDLYLYAFYEARYWVASHSNDSTGVAISIGPLWKVKFTDEPRSNGYAVRLVKDIK